MNRFEVWLTSTGEYNLSKDANGKYLLNTVQLAWEAWQAGKASNLINFDEHKPVYDEEALFLYRGKGTNSEVKSAIAFYTSDPQKPEYIEGEPFYSDYHTDFEFGANDGEYEVLAWVSINKLIKAVVKWK